MLSEQNKFDLIWFETGKPPVTCTNRTKVIESWEVKTCISLISKKSKYTLYTYRCIPLVIYRIFTLHSTLSAHWLTCCTLHYTPALPPSPVSQKSHRMFTNYKSGPGQSGGAVAPFAPY